MNQAPIEITTDSPGPDVPRGLFGTFVEHLGRAVYDGLYAPGHPSAGDDGFREDVLALVRELGATMVRYPGGNFVSGYCWEEGFGPDRPVRLDAAWHSIEPNTVGLHEFAAWAERAGLGADRGDHVDQLGEIGHRDHPDPPLDRGTASAVR